MSYNKEYYSEWKKKNAGKLAAYERKRAEARSTSEEWARKHAESCKKSQHKLWKENPQKALWQRAKARAKQRGIEFSIQVSDITIPEYCPLLNTKIS